jgi:sRNA-binding carbon storage regulator CsrA
MVLAVDGREIRVEVARVDGGQVRLAFTPPDDVAIRREEAVDR